MHKAILIEGEVSSQKLLALPLIKIILRLSYVSFNFSFINGFPCSPDAVGEGIKVHLRKKLF